MLKPESQIDLTKVIFERIKLEFAEDTEMKWVRFENVDIYIDALSKHVRSKIHLEFYERLAETKSVEIRIARPSFLDWLLCREKKFFVDVNLKEILPVDKISGIGQPYLEIVQPKFIYPSK